MKRNITNELIKKWREALTTDNAIAEKVLTRLRLHEEHGTISPDMDVLEYLTLKSQLELVELAEKDVKKDVKAFQEALVIHNIRDIEKIVDKYHLSSNYLDKPFQQLVFDILRTYELQCQCFEQINQLSGKIPAFDGDKQDLTDGLTMALLWAYQISKDANIAYNYDFDDEILYTTLDFIYQYAVPYSKICDAYASYSRNRFKAEIVKNDVFFKAVSEQLNTFAAEIGEFLEKSTSSLNTFNTKADAIMVSNKSKEDKIAELANLYWNETSILPADWTFDNFSLQDYKKCWFELFFMVEDHVISHTSQERKNCIIVMEKDCFLEAIQEKTQLSKNKIEAILELMVFDSKMKHVDIRYQPLILIGSSIFITPSLIMNEIPERSLIAVIQRLNKDKSHSSNVNRLEGLMRDQIRAHLAGRKEFISNHDIVLKNGENIVTDIDFCIYDFKSNSVLICEMKWLLEAELTHDVYVREDEVDHGCKQVENAMGYAMSNSNDFMERAFRMNVDAPVEYFCCVITKTNIRHNNKFVPTISQRKFEELLDSKKSLREIFEIVRNKEYIPQLESNTKFEDRIVEYAGYTFHTTALKAI